MADTETNPPIGTRVRFKADRLGLMENVNAHHFEPETVGGGDEGIYQGPHPQLAAEDWHIVHVTVNGRELVAPVHRDQFEEVPA